MKKEESIIKNTIKLTKDTDDRLSKYATKNSDCIKVRGITKEADDFDIRWPFEIDIDRMLYCKSYQRYVDKTQALSFFNNVHIAKRSIHVQWVSRIARQIGRALNLNLDLIEAIALGHDLGHAPYGHVGEKALDEMAQKYKFGYFCHNANSVRNILYIERDGIGYNVSLQVLDGILCHNGEMLSKKYTSDPNKTVEQFWQEYHDCWKVKDNSLHIRPMTLEGCVVRVSDIIAYIGKDIEDSIKVGIIKQENIPEEVVKVLGDDNKSIMNRLVGDIVIHSYKKPYLEFSDEVFSALQRLLQFLSEEIHNHPVLIKENKKLMRIVEQLYDLYFSQLTDPNTKYPIHQYVDKMIPTYSQSEPELIVLDYISAMTDGYVLRSYQETFLPKEYDEIV